MKKSEMESALLKYKEELETIIVESEKEVAYMSVKYGMFIQLYQIYSTEYRNTLKSLEEFACRLYSLYTELGRSIKLK